MVICFLLLTVWHIDMTWQQVISLSLLDPSFSVLEQFHGQAIVLHSVRVSSCLHGLCESLHSAQVAIFGLLALLPIAFISLATELRARQHFAAHMRMSREEIGPFWNCELRLANLASARL